MIATEEIVELITEDKTSFSASKETDPLEAARLEGAEIAVKSIVIDELGNALAAYDGLKEAQRKEKPWAVNMDAERQLLERLHEMLTRNANAYKAKSLGFGVQHGFPEKTTVLNTNPTADNFQDHQAVLTTIKSVP